MTSFSALKQKCYLRYAGYISDIEKEYAHHIRSLQSQKKRVIEMVTDEFEKCIGHITACEAETQRRNQCKALTEQFDVFMEHMNKEQIQQKQPQDMLKTQLTSPPPRPPMPSLPQHLRNNDGDEFEMAQCSSIESLDLSECNNGHDHDSEYECAEDPDMDSDCNVVANTHATHGAKNKSEKTPAHRSKPAINDWGEAYTDIEGPKGASNAFIASMEDTSNDITTTNTDKETERIKKKRNKNRQKRLKQFEQCKICKQKFASINAFETHCYTVHEIRQPFACPASKCDKRYATCDAMDYHYRRIHEQEINHRCESCKKPFFLQCEYVQHIKNCSNPYWRIPCKLCPETGNKLVTFESHKRWKAHMHEVHEIKQPYNCLVCLPNVRRFTTKSNIIDHIRNVHKQERRFQCQLCSKSFYKLHKLQKHQRVHDGKKPFQCSICKKRFGSKVSLNEHHKRVHEGQLRHQCNLCGKRFYDRSHLRKHSVARHNDRTLALYECDVCHKPFYERSELVRHKKSHK